MKNFKAIEFTVVTCVDANIVSKGFTKRLDQFQGVTCWGRNVIPKVTIVRVQGWWVFEGFLRVSCIMDTFWRTTHIFFPKKQNSPKKTIHIFAWLFFCGKNITGFQGPPTKHVPGAGFQWCVFSRTGWTWEIGRHGFCKKSVILACPYRWWFRNPANQLRLVFYPIRKQGCLHPRWLFGMSEPSTVSSMGQIYVPRFGLFL